MQKCQQARAEEVAKRELARRVASENLMLASNKRRINVQNDVTDSMRAQVLTDNAKISYSNMIR